MAYSRPVKVATVLLAAMAAVLAGLLLYQSQTLESLPGCGGGSGCEQVLSSRWSAWLGIPVSLPALLVYTAMLAAALMRDTRVHRPQPPTEWILLCVGVAAIAAALWFVTVQIAMVGALCKYCLATHAAGVAAGVLSILTATAVLPAKAWTTAGGCAVVLVGVLIAGQVLSDAPEGSGPSVTYADEGPALSSFPGIDLTVPKNDLSAPPQPGDLFQPSLPDRASDVTESKPDTTPPRITTSPSVRQPVESRIVKLYGGRIEIDIAPLPVIGNPRASDVLLVLFDYFCPHCRDTRRMLEKTADKYGNRLAIVCLPTPLNSRCNKFIRRYVAKNRHSCDLAKLSLAVWRADPQKWPAYDKQLYSDPEILNKTKATILAWDMIGEKTVEQALKDPWVEQQVERDVSLYGLCAKASGKSVVPMLVTRYGIMNGTPSSPRDIEKLIEGSR